MAQKTEKEDQTEFKVVSETLTLCINNCTFTGTPATNNMCQKCFTANSAGILIFSGDKTTRSTSSTSPLRSNRRSDLNRVVDRIPTVALEVAMTKIFKKELNRCSGCRKKVGLTGFRCRCGDLFCSEHRYSDRHECSYDYRSAGREAIARENPVVKAAKIVRV